MNLRVVGLRKTFGGLVAVDGCSFDCAPGTITGLVGPNGSGKSTLFNIVTGIAAADAGDVFLGDRRLTGLRPHRVARAGIGRTFQTTRLFPSLTVLQNVLLGRSSTSPSASAEDAQALLDRFGVGAFAARNGSALSFGQQRLVELARATIAKPSFILLDEPFAGLSPPMAADLERHIAGLVASGVGVLLIEHDLVRVMDMCPRILVMHGGRKIADGPADEVQRDAAVIASYLGEAHVDA